MVNKFKRGVIISVWSIVQASFHLVWVIFGFLLRSCTIQPKQYWLIFVYFTYFYSKKCGEIVVESSSVPFCLHEDLYTIIKNLNERAKFPEESQNAARTDFYIFIYMIADSLWLVTSLFMLVGLYLKVKKLTSLCFYSPFLLSTATIILLDVVAAVHYGLDIHLVHDYTTWLKFIGVENYKDFVSYNKHVTSKYIPVMTPILLCVFFGKCLVFWIVNVINFYKVVNLAILAFLDEPTNYYGNVRRRLQAADKALNRSRISNWQDFYGQAEDFSYDTTSLNTMDNFFIRKEHGRVSFQSVDVNLNNHTTRTVF